MKVLFFFFASLFICLQPAYAIDEGTAEGTITVNNETIAISYVYAHLHDNAEGLLDRPKELRIVLSDRKVPQESLRGIVFLPVEDLARENRMRGLMMQLNPNDPGKIVVTLLQAPPTSRHSLMTLTLSATGEKLFKKLNVSKTRVDGEVEHFDTRSEGGTDLPKLSYSAIFSAPLFNELPVTADLKGMAAQKSPQVKIYREKIIAMKKGDFETVKRLSSERANRRNAVMLAQLGDQAKVMAAEGALEMEQSLKQVKRVVVRGDTAVMFFSEKHWATFVREGTNWKTDD
ncbi:MAG: hypothetical protein C0399_04805 [Syntrophus sp. (in: bacteria)]|nr:hypothetical protein [Syntrophus sp. (in: bacteria)]